MKKVDGVQFQPEVINVLLRVNQRGKYTILQIKA